MKRFLVLLLTLCICLGAEAKIKYIFYFIGDGMGLNQVLMTDAYRDVINQEPMVFSSFPYIGYLTNTPTDSGVTDSAAAATALACGCRTSNASIGVDAEGKSHKSIAELAKAKGMKVGVITNVAVNQATPAAFCAHQRHRGYTYEIALDMINAGFDFYGGSDIENDSKDRFGKKLESARELFRKAGYTICNYEQWRIKPEEYKKVLMLPGRGQKLRPAIDMDKEDPSLHFRLAQQTEAAIEHLSRDNKKGFFLMVEGGLIDSRCHSHDPAGTVKEIGEMDDAVKKAYEFYLKHPKETIIIVTADHETGSLSLTTDKRQNLALLNSQQYSKSRITSLLKKRLKEEGSMTWEETRLFLRDNFGFWDSIRLTTAQEQRLFDVYRQSIAKSEAGSVTDLYSDNALIVSVASDILCEILEIHWVGGHSCSYVPVYAIGKGAERFAIKGANTEIFGILRKLARL